MTDALLSLLYAAGAGLFAGAVNTIAGGGSLVTLPLLIFLGLPPNVANGTNRVGILLQSIVATAAFKREGALEPRAALKLLLPTLLGALLGALLSADLDPALFKRIIAGALLVMLALMLYKQFKKNKPLPPDAPPPPPRPYLLQAAAFFGVGLYGGFLQAGVGLFLLAALNLVSDLELVRANALKVALTLGLTLVALPVFILHDQIDWPLGAALGLGSMLGAALGARLAVSWGPRFIQIVLIGVVIASALKLVWDG